ncbi:ABC transporter permease [Rhodoligotrophos defluvii]|uniref:ABC transporter permease n=1 Tax=Rhodoligotrophos defluvii TaxID=2561934 RepID=UPI0010C9A521|nr:ABC transporter permease [Rhodoligotrophos defluvii]
MWREFRSSPTAIAGAAISLVVLIAILVVPMVMPYSPTAMSFTTVLKPPSLQHLFGTDSFGRDVFTRVLHGARVSLLISGIGVGVALLIGTAIGMTAAYTGRLYDLVVMRVMDLLFSFPAFVLALFLMVVIGFGVINVSLAIALVYIPIFARLAHNLTMTVREEAYVQAARVMGQPAWRLLLFEVLPNIAAPLMVQASIGVAFGIIIEAGLSFLGLGVQPPTPSLGVIMADGQEYFRRAPWVLTMSGLAVCFALLGLNLLGDGLRDMVDPRLRKRMG